MNNAIAELLELERKRGNVSFIVSSKRIIAVFDSPPHGAQAEAILSGVRQSTSVPGGYTIAACPTRKEAEKAAQQLANPDISIANVMAQQAEKNLLREAIRTLARMLTAQQKHFIGEDIIARKEAAEAGKAMKGMTIRSDDVDRALQMTDDTKHEPLSRIKYSGRRAWLEDVAGELGLGEKYQMAMRYFSDERYGLTLTPEKKLRSAQSDYYGCIEISLQKIQDLERAIAKQEAAGKLRNNSPLVASEGFTQSYLDALKSKNPSPKR